MQSFLAVPLVAISEQIESKTRRYQSAQELNRVSKCFQGVKENLLTETVELVLAFSVVITVLKKKSRPALFLLHQRRKMKASHSSFTFE